MTTKELIKRSMDRLRKCAEENPGYAGEMIADFGLVNFARSAMEEKLRLKREGGRYGWWREECFFFYLRQMLHEHIEKGDMVDVMNLAAMIYVREIADGEQQQ